MLIVAIEGQMGIFETSKIENNEISKIRFSRLTDLVGWKVLQTQPSEKSRCPIDQQKRD